LDAHYADPWLAQLYDVDSGWGPDRDYYLAQPGDGPLRILDLGCGTGTLTLAYAAAGHRVRGADPAAPMLDVARAKPGAAAVTWVLSDAAGFRSDDRFDLIVMTGHAFQTLLTPLAMTAALSTMRAHLAPKGRVIFETRNPAIDWADQWNGFQSEHALPSGTLTVTRRVLGREPGFITFETGYLIGQDLRLSRSRLAFPTLTTVETALRAAGLVVATLCGDWDGRPFDSATSPEIIVTARRLIRSG
jgi:SAM-dependent methyltransferase